MLNALGVKSNGSDIMSQDIFKKSELVTKSFMFITYCHEMCLKYHMSFMSKDFLVFSYVTFVFFGLFRMKCDRATFQRVPTLQHRPVKTGMLLELYLQVWRRGS